LQATPVPCDEEITIGVDLRSQRQGRWAFESRTMEEEAARLGAELVLQYANEDPALQASQIENLLSQDVDALILGAVDTQAAAALVDSAHEAGVPVVAYDAPIDNPSLDYFVTRNNVNVGVVQAEAALRFSPTGNWAIFKGDASAGVAQEIAQGYDQVLKEAIDAGEISVVLDQFHQGWDATEALNNAENVLSRYSNDVPVFLVSNDGMAAGVAQALVAQDLAGEVFLSGLDAEPANLRLIANGVQTMTVWAPLEEWAVRGVDAAYELACGREPPADGTTAVTGGEIPTGLVSTLEVNRDNLCEFVTEIAPEGWASRDEVFADNPDLCPV
jgi:D-xylose transport system substrate-binding protein